MGTSEMEFTYEKLLELKKRFDFNKTEPQVLVQLIDEALTKSRVESDNRRRLRILAERIIHELESGSEEEADRGILIHTLNETMYESTSTNLEGKIIYGVDGSYYLVGGEWGIYYAPVSVVRMRQEISKSDISLERVEAKILKIDESKSPVKKVDSIASRIMLVYESVATYYKLPSSEDKIIFIDGPIYDPPFMDRIFNKDYIKFRAECIQKSLKLNSVIVGIVKRTQDKQFMEDLTRSAISDDLKNKLMYLRNDQVLMSYLFTAYRLKKNIGDDIPILSKIMELKNDVSGYYLSHGIKVFSYYYQRRLNSRPIRVDIAVPANEDGPQQSDLKIINAILTSQIYPGFSIPMIVQMAHEKCSIREGLAKVLYEEIIGRRGADLFDYITSSFWF